MTRIGLISDVHASPVALRQALEIFQHEQVHDIICAGDIAGYFDQLTPTIDLLKSFLCKTISGNHDTEYLQANVKKPHSKNWHFLHALPKILTLTIENQSVYVVHAQPPLSQHGGIKLLDINGDIIPNQKQFWTAALADFDHDILIIGHTHQVFAEFLGKTLVVNPGSTQFNHSCMILTLPEKTVKTFALDNKPIVKCWNFSQLFAQGNTYPTANE